MSPLLLIASLLAAEPKTAAAILDAGPPRVAEWIAFDGVTRGEDGTTDKVRLSVGAAVDVLLPRLALQVVCDSPEVRADPLPNGYRLVGVSPGHTHCGFWFDEGQPPSRYFDIAVIK